MPDFIEVPASVIRASDLLLEMPVGVGRWRVINSGYYYRVTEVITPGRRFRGYATDNPEGEHEWEPPVNRFRIAPRTNEVEDTMALHTRNYAAVSSAIKEALTAAGDSPLVRQGVLATAHAVAHAIEFQALANPIDVAAFLTACGVPDNQ